MKILFNGLGPTDTVTYNEKVYRNGSVVSMPESFAAAYLDSHMAVEVKTTEDEKEALALQELEKKNSRRRKTIQEKAQKKDETEVS